MNTNRAETETDRVYVMDIEEPFHPDTGEIPQFGGVSLDLTVQVTEARRYILADLCEMGELHQWRVHSELERTPTPFIFEMPANTMVRLSRIETLYHSREFGFWGRKGEPVPDAERQAYAERERYRQEHRDGIDPLKAVAKATAAKLPKPIKNAPNVYVAAHYGLVQRRVGVFTTYEQALAVAPDTATILEVPANGHTEHWEAKLVRGGFPSGWGYASGYSPDEIR